MGALSDYLQKKWGVRTRSVENPVVDETGADVTQVLRNNPDRFMVLIVNLDGTDQWLGFAPDVSDEKGILLDASGGYAVFTADDDGELVGYDMFVYSVAGGPIYVLETEAA